MKIEDQNWMQVEGYLQKDDRAILVLGACEQHGYLSLMTDVKIPMALAEEASHQSGVLLAPPLNFGCSPYFLNYPGTISLRLHTYLNLVEDLLRSLYGVGFRKVLILNGHGGNIPVKTHLVELVNQLPDLKLRWYDWWLTDIVAQVAKKYGLDSEHGSWMEAFDFTIVTELPDAVKPLPQVNQDLLGKDDTREIYQDGSFGGAYRVDPAIMDELFAALLAEVINLLDFTVVRP